MRRPTLRAEQATVDLVPLRRDVARLASQGRSWDERVTSFRASSDQDLDAARTELQALIADAEEALASAQRLAPDDREEVGQATIALKRLIGADAWAGYVLHMRKPPTDLNELLGLPPNAGR